MARRTSLSLGVVALFALALPTLASANWWHEGKGEYVVGNPSITLKGDLTLSTSSGSITCHTTIGATLTGGTSKGHVNSVTFSKPSECDLGGALGEICGTHGLTKIEKTGTWSLSAEPGLELSGINIDYAMSECLAAGLRVSGTASLGADSENAISNVTFGFGEPQIVHNEITKKTSSGSLSGTFSMSPAATYGITPPPPHVWTVGGETLGEEESVTAGLEGFFQLSTAGFGSYGCPVTIAIQAEGPSGGQIESHNPTTAECSGTGFFANCQLIEDTSNPPWGMSIAYAPGTVTGPITLHSQFTGCAFSTFHLVFNSFAVVPTLDEEGNITALHISGTATNGLTTTSGTFTFESEQPSLGIEQTS